jgi:hypothetical protein
MRDLLEAMREALASGVAEEQYCDTPVESRAAFSAIFSELKLTIDSLFAKISLFDYERTGSCMSNFVFQNLLFQFDRFGHSQLTC